MLPPAKLLERLAKTIKSAAVCGMGGMAPGAVLTTLEHFRDEFESHIRDKRCPAGVCKNVSLKEQCLVH